MSPTTGTDVGRRILAYAPSRFIEPLLGLIAVPILTRSLGPSGYGDFQVILTTTMLIRIVAFEWVNNCALRFFRPMQNNPGSYHSNLAAGWAIGLFLAVGLILGFRSWLPGDIVSAMAGIGGLSILAAAAEGAARNQEMTLRAMHRPVAFSVTRASLALARHGAGLALLLIFDNSFAAYLHGWAWTTAVIAIVAWVRMGAASSLRRFSPNFTVLREFASFGFPLAVVLLANSTQIFGVRYVLQEYSGSESTGLFSAAYNIGGVAVTFYQSIIMVGLYPLAVDAFEDDRPLDNLVREGLRYFFLAALPLLCMIVLTSRSILEIISGAAYSSANATLAILSLGAFVYGVSQYFSLLKQTSRIAVINLLGAGINIALAFAWVPRWSHVGAAWATTVGFTTVLVGAMVLGIRPSRKNVPGRTILRCFAACLPMIPAWLFSKDSSPWGQVFWVAGVGGAAYVMLLWRLGEVRFGNRPLTPGGSAPV